MNNKMALKTKKYWIQMIKNFYKISRYRYSKTLITIIKMTRVIIKKQSIYNNK